MLDDLGAAAKDRRDDRLAVLHGLEVDHAERVEADRGRHEDIGAGIGRLQFLALEPAGAHDALGDAELARFRGELLLVELLLAQHEQAQRGEARREECQHAQELAHALLRVQSPADRDHLRTDEAVLLAEEPLRLCVGQARLEGDGVVQHAIDADAVLAQGLRQLLRDGAHAVRPDIRGGLHLGTAPPTERSQGRRPGSAECRLPG